MKKVLFYDEMIILPDEFLEEFKPYKFNAKELAHFHLLESKCEILLSRSTIKANEKLLSGVPLKYYATATAGFEHVDLEYLKNREIRTFVASGSNSNSVAEYVIINVYNYIKKQNKNFNEITIGIVGFGNIGKKVAYYCNLMGIKIIVNDPPLLDSNFTFPDYVEYQNLDDLIRNSNIITNHVPMDTKGQYQTIKLFDDNLTLLNENTLFIHASRGGVVNEKSLLKYAYPKNCDLVIDVWEGEPEVNQKLINASIITTPHIAGHSYNAKLNSSQMILNDLFMKGFTKNNYLIDNKKEEFVNIKNIIDKIELAIKRREIENDSAYFKNNPNMFSEFRKNYPKRNESLFMKN